MRDFLAETLRGSGFEVDAHSQPGEALAAWPAFAPDVAFLDLRLPGMSGVEVLQQARAAGARTVCVVLTAYGTVETAVAALREGADDYLLKPCPAERIERAAEQALRVMRLKSENRRLREVVRTGARGEIVGQDPELRRLLDQLPTLARSRATVLITGESGTGKELVARALHELGPRAEGPWVSLNCAAVPEALLESELFGYEKGAFTGAASRHPGRFEQAQGGTLLLDEISEIQPALQAKLLRALQEREYFRLGGVESVRVDVRVVATTNRDLKPMLASGTFRADLFYRLNVVSLHLPALRERPGDVGLLASHFLTRAAAETGRALEGFAPAALRRLESYAWPGNVRELSNAVERAAVFSAGPRVEESDLQLDGAAPIPRAAGFNLSELERETIFAALRATGGHRVKTARALGISVRTLRNKLQQYREDGLAAAQFLPPGGAELSPSPPPAEPPALRPAA